MNLEGQSRTRKLIFKIIHQGIEEHRTTICFDLTRSNEMNKIERTADCVHKAQLTASTRHS